ncbi:MULTISPECIES: sugar phosphate isomerase/epimerase [Paenibacillus]|uniref:Sugar phosphate isomerase/epimerase n=1 Tax=Paenibacillus violae TaxID=3077234 RepID=A0ABU3R6B4_9BACL|nr:MULTISPECIES: sugar phosphate isomerase/epimerase [Paenibacillus]MDU0199798.1 sugar phosphate isomerase/epimerase [Paenibacillus sp. PFR10]MEC0267987.1 sugar phosphate isomerase/epimerase [Paenibacillus anseongense]
MGRLGIGLQLYTLRDDMAKDLEGTLRHVAKLGYEGVEFAGYFDKPAAEMKDLLDELGLKAIGSHVSLERFRNNLQGEIDYLHTIGAKYAICPYVGAEERENAEQWRKLIAECEQIAIEVGKQGLQFLYHNHDFEFHHKVDGEFVFDAMYAGKDAIQVEMDVCWVKYAGQDPLAYIAKYAGRLPLLHFKDFSKDAEGKLVTLELGLGEVPLEQVIKAAEQAGVEWLVVEQDHCQKPPLVSIENSLNWVKEHYINVVPN